MSHHYTYAGVIYIPDPYTGTDFTDTYTYVRNIFDQNIHTSRQQRGIWIYGVKNSRDGKL